MTFQVQLYPERGSRVICRIEGYLSSRLAWRTAQSPLCHARFKPHLWITNRPPFLERTGWFSPVQTSLAFFGAGLLRRTGNLPITVGKLCRERDRSSLSLWCFTLDSSSTVPPHVSKETPDSLFPRLLLTLDDITRRSNTDSQEWITLLTWSGAIHWFIMGQTNTPCNYSIAVQRKRNQIKTIFFRLDFFYFTWITNFSFQNVQTLAVLSLL